MFMARFALVAVLGTALTAQGADLTKGTPDIKSAGPLAFGPNGLLFVGDTQGGAIFAVEHRRPPAASDSAGGSIKVDAINDKVAGLLGTDAREITINDMAVNPASGKAYLSVSRGRGPTATPVVVRVDRSGKPEVVSARKRPVRQGHAHRRPRCPPPRRGAPVAKKNARRRQAPAARLSRTLPTWMEGSMSPGSRTRSSPRG